MTQKEFDAKFPLILGWIQKTLADHTGQAQSIASLGFKRLPRFFPSAVLAQAKVVYLPAVPVPPLTKIGLSQFSDFEAMNAAGITYLDTFFSREEMRGNESHHFHEMVHVIQWQALGPKRFLECYADGLERCGYRHSPLEVMAYTLENVFNESGSAFDTVAIINQQIRELYQ
jgi:hypothetical protein